MNIAISFSADFKFIASSNSTLEIRLWLDMYSLIKLYRGMLTYRWQKYYIDNYGDVAIRSDFGSPTYLTSDLNDFFGCMKTVTRGYWFY